MAQKLAGQTAIERLWRNLQTVLGNKQDKIDTTGVIIANGDALVLTDSSASNKLVKSSITFNGSTTTKFLSQKGTWETPTGGISYEVVGTL